VVTNTIIQLRLDGHLTAYHVTRSTGSQWRNTSVAAYRYLFSLFI